jgi:hypothetical protein
VSIDAGGTLAVDADLVRALPEHAMTIRGDPMDGDSLTLPIDTDPGLACTPDAVTIGGIAADPRARTGTGHVEHWDGLGA